MFKETLNQIVSKTDGAVGAMIMGLDGISVARSKIEGVEEIEIDVVAAEYTAMLRTAIRTGEDSALGNLRQLAIISERFAILVEPITTEYVLLLVLRSHASIGRARFELRKAQLVLEEEFSV